VAAVVVAVVTSSHLLSVSRFAAMYLLNHMSLIDTHCRVEVSLLFSILPGNDPESVKNQITIGKDSIHVVGNPLIGHHGIFIQKRNQERICNNVLFIFSAVLSFFFKNKIFCFCNIKEIREFF